MTVEVRNASGIAGLAAQVLQSLVTKGFVAGPTGNSEAMAKSVVRYGKGGEAGANAVQKVLGGMKIEQDVNVPPAGPRVPRLGLLGPRRAGFHRLRSTRPGRCASATG